MSYSTILVLLLLPLVAVSQIIHSIERMSKAIQLQGVLADQLQEYVIEEQQRLEMIKMYAKELKETSATTNITRNELELEMSHPVRALRFISDMSSKLQIFRESVHMAKAPQVQQTLAHLPSHNDYMDAVQALVRLQEVYDDQADFSRPQKNNTKDVLTADEILEIGKVCSQQENFYSALNNLKRAKEMFEEVNNTESAMKTYDFLAYVMYQQHNSEYALNYTYQLLEYYDGKDSESVTRLNENIETYIEDLGGEDKAKEQLQLLKPYDNEVQEEYTNYNELCRGESVEVADKDTKPLQCHMYTNNNHPLLILSPAKKEDINTKTGLSFFHHVLTDREIKLLQEKASSKFEDSQLVPDDDIRNDPNIQLEDEHGYADTKVRSSNTGWVDDADDEMVLALSKRISAILDLTIKSSESFQVLSYGIGGFYLPHFDWGDGDHPFADFDGNRIATWIFYLNDIKKGGATVFPDIGATVWPEKGGAAFWRNLYRNGTGNPLTLHAACPVLEGYKWASNKWFHTVGNEFSWPCSTDVEM